ncbi:MAG: hypothetical protein IKL39_00305 [Mailhella sp.]|nr:hypothetical protein [Mailhella sp.]MBR6673162.1 hypothetical protein [Mailhella sp.]
MTTDKNLWEEQVSRAKKLLENLPPKDSKKTKKEAASELEEDFKKAMSRGYTAAQISDILKNEGIDIPAYIIKKVCKGFSPKSKNHRENTEAEPETPVEQI